jgi:hypothetical protein
MSIPSNGWNIPLTGCEAIGTRIGALRSWNMRTQKPLRPVVFPQSSKAKKGTSNFGSKEVLMQTGTSGSKSKGPGCKIFPGIVRCQDGSEISRLYRQTRKLDRFQSLSEQAHAARGPPKLKVMRQSRFGYPVARCQGRSCSRKTTRGNAWSVRMLQCLNTPVGISIFSKPSDGKWNQPLDGVDVMTAKASDGVVLNEGNPFDCRLVVASRRVKVMYGPPFMSPGVRAIVR